MIPEISNEFQDYPGGYGLKIPSIYLSDAENKSKELGTKIFVDRLPGDKYVVVACYLPQDSSEKREFDNYMRILLLRENAAVRPSQK